MSRSQLVKLPDVLDLDTAVEGFNKYDCTIDSNTIKGFRNMKVSQLVKDQVGVIHYEHTVSNHLFYINTKNIYECYCLINTIKNNQKCSKIKTYNI